MEEDLSDPDLVLDDDISPDENPPSIRILDPAACSEPITSTGSITVTGVASDAESGIRKVEAFSHSYPFDENVSFQNGHAVVCRRLVFLEHPCPDLRRCDQDSGQSDRQLGK